MHLVIGRHAAVCGELATDALHLGSAEIAVEGEGLLPVVACFGGNAAGLVCGAPKERKEVGWPLTKS